MEDSGKMARRDFEISFPAMDFFSRDFTDVGEETLNCLRWLTSSDLEWIKTNNAILETKSCFWFKTI